MAKETEMSMGSLYEINQQLMNREKVLIDKEINDALKPVETLFNNHKYLMLLCHEKRDYTIFNRTNKIANAASAIEILKECLTNRGKVLSIDKTNDGAFEIWLRIDNQSSVYFLFPYDEAVIEW